ncbi:MAG TPA: OmpA family protein [Elusimicrobiales bacterium]|nr:OmpA family protein [Elusimicrobiales bacterium]
MNKHFTKLSLAPVLSAVLILLHVSVTHTALFGPGARQLALVAMEKLTPSPDLDEPPVRFSVLSEDPDFGGLTPVDTQALGEFRAWQLQILDQGGHKVSFVQGKGRLPGDVLPWYGLSEDGEPLPSGFYSARLAWMGPDKIPHASRSVTFSLFTPPEIAQLSARELKFNYAPEGLVISLGGNIAFRPGEARIPGEALPALRKITVFLKTYSRNAIVIRGYADLSETAADKVALSRARAESVRAYLVDSGIAPLRLTPEGLGADNPAAPESADNRRVDVVVRKTAG